MNQNPRDRVADGIRRSLARKVGGFQSPAAPCRPMAHASVSLLTGCYAWLYGFAEMSGHGYALLSPSGQPYMGSLHYAENGLTLYPDGSVAAVDHRLAVHRDGVRTAWHCSVHLRIFGRFRRRA